MEIHLVIHIQRKKDFDWKGYKKILEILKYVDKAYVDKIPKKLIDFFKENKAMDYDFKYDSSYNYGLFSTSSIKEV